MNESFEQFIRERQFLQNVSTRTIGWYRDVAVSGWERGKLKGIDLFPNDQT